MNSKSIKKQYEQDLERFSQQKDVQDAKERMFENITAEMAKDDKTIDYSEIFQQDSEIDERKSRENHQTRRQVFAAAAAVLVVVVTGRAFLDRTSSQGTQFNPPLAQSDIPEYILHKDMPYRTVATNNDFYIGYVNTPYRVGTLDLVVHSRSGNVDWSTLTMIDEENDSVKPLAINESENMVSIPASESDVFFEVKDSKGNTIECILPTYI